MTKPPIVRVISLVGSDRRAAMAAQLDPLGIDWAFFDASTRPPESPVYDPLRARRDHGRELTPGELGCFASHMALWRLHTVAFADRTMLVLEDDLLLDPVFFSNLEAADAAFARFDYLRLYAKVPAGMHREGSFLNRHVARFSGRAYGTQAYMISPAGSRRFLSSITSVVRPIDDEMDRYWAHGLPTRSVFPAPVIEVQRGSTIEAVRREATALNTKERLAWSATKAMEKLRRHAAAFRN
jgi:glycosyl transferase, family 25